MLGEHFVAYTVIGILFCSSELINHNEGMHTYCAYLPSQMKHCPQPNVVPCIATEVVKIKQEFLASMLLAILF
jgi:hypothetical protein